jgi:hypothetical protein
MLAYCTLVTENIHMLIRRIQMGNQPATSPAIDPETVFHTFNAAVNAHDVNAALACFAVDASVHFPNQPPPNVFQGETEIRRWLEEDAKQNIHVEIADMQLVGDTLTGIGRVASDDLRPLGITIEGPFEVTVQQGLITSFNYAFNEETLAKLQAVQAS